jgi:hypothetical protein
LEDAQNRLEQEKRDEKREEKRAADELKSQERLWPCF